MSATQTIHIKWQALFSLKKVILNVTILLGAFLELINEDVHLSFNVCLFDLGLTSL